MLPQRFPGRRTGQESLPRPNHRIGQPGTTGEIFGRRRLSYGPCAQSQLYLCTIKNMFKSNQVRKYDLTVLTEFVEDLLIITTSIVLI